VPLGPVVRGEEGDPRAAMGKRQAPDERPHGVASAIRPVVRHEPPAPLWTGQRPYGVTTNTRRHQRLIQGGLDAESERLLLQAQPHASWNQTGEGAVLLLEGTWLQISLGRRCGVVGVPRIELG